MIEVKTHPQLATKGEGQIRNGVCPVLIENKALATVLGHEALRLRECAPKAGI